MSKRKPSSDIKAAYAAGLTNFGENYLQEALPKIAELADLPITWHFIGAIQSNKTRAIAENFHWVHTIDRVKVARRLADQCPPGKVLQACIQVNIDADPAKAGAAPKAVGNLLAELGALTNLRLRGLMAILDLNSDPLQSYRRVQELFVAVGREQGSHWDTLSMGMSRDFEAAIEAGATFVRVGTEIFGARQ